MPISLPDNSWKVAPEIEEVRDKVAKLDCEELVPAEADIDYDAYALPAAIIKRVQGRGQGDGLLVRRLAEATWGLGDAARGPVHRIRGGGEEPDGDQELTQLKEEAVI